MRQLSKFVGALFPIVVAAVLLSGTALAQSGNALIRFVHVLPGAGQVDVYVDGAPAIRSLDYGQATLYVSVPAGSRSIVTTLAGATTPLWTQDFAPAVGQAYTLVVSSTEPLAYTAYQDDLNSLPVGTTRVTALHAIADAPAVDVVLADGRAVVPGLEYNQPYGTLDIPALTYELAVVPAGGTVADAVVPATPFALNTGTSYAIVAYGTRANPATLVLSAPTAPAGSSGYLRVVHGVSGAPAVDIFANDTMVAPGLAYGADTGFIAIPTGDYAVSIRAAGSTDEIAAATLSIEPDVYLSVVALPDEDRVVVQAFETGVENADQLTASVAAINGALGQDVTVSIETGDGAAVIDAVASGDVGLATTTPSLDGLEAIVNRDGMLGSNSLAPLIYGGVAYTAVIVPSGDGVEVLDLQPVAVAQTIGSAPGVLLSAALPAQAAAEPTPTAIPAGDVAAAQVVQATPEPQVVQPTAAPATQTPAFPTARVVLDPGANIQLRQYPSRDAFSLGLAPSGTIFIVNGREGLEALPPGQPTPTVGPEETPEVDPATELPEGEDLVPADTWLNIDYITPDGGVINAWVNAQYLEVRDARGNRARLADLPTVPRNRPGEARDTAVQPPPLPQDVTVAIVGGLDSGVNLQIRRTPNTGGESLALVPNGTALELIGINEAREWAYVRYVQPEGGVVRGWVNLSFITGFTFRNIPTDLARLETQGRLSFVPDSQRGDLTSGAAAPAAPTRDPLRNVVVATVRLNEGANLHLRRNPNANAESIALMPNGTQLIVSGRTDTAEWVQVEFEGQIGWTFAQFLTFAFNGAPYDLQEVPITFAFNITPTATETPSA
jgi:hypothetical protein